METTPEDELSAQMRAFDKVSQLTLVKLLKENEFERTELVEDGEGTRYVRKYLDVEEGHVHPYERLVGVDVPYAAKVLSADRIADKLVVVCEYIDGQTLQDYVEDHGPLYEETAQRYVGYLSAALSCLHSAAGGPIVHRDVNPSNIIVNDAGAWLIDLGISRTRVEGADQDTHTWGTAGYAAPEQFGFGQTDARTDVYALGKVLLFMVTGNGDAPLKEVSSLRARRVIEKATAIDPDRRYQTPEDLKDDLMNGHALGLGTLGAGLGSVPKGVFLVWRVVATLIAAVFTLGFALDLAEDADAARIVSDIVIWALLCAVPWLASTDMFGILGKLHWFGGRRWLSAVVIIAVSLAALFTFFSIWLTAGLPLE